MMCTITLYPQPREALGADRLVAPRSVHLNTRARFKLFDFDSSVRTDQIKLLDFSDAILV